MMYNLTMRKLLSIIVILVLIFTTINLAKGSYDSYKKLKEVNSGQGDLNSLRLKNDELKKELSQKQSDFALEKEARDKLGYGKAGETAIVVHDVNLSSKVNNSMQKQKSNLQKWLELLKISLWYF